MSRKKYYVVWSGRKPGIYTTWHECQQQVSGYSGAKFKSYPSLAAAEQAFNSDYEQPEKQTNQAKTTDYILESISVDAACSGNPGDMEYRGVDTDTGAELFHVGPVQNGTNNIGEFLAIVHALAMLKKENNPLPIYSDSQVAIKWVRDQQVNTTLPKDDSTKRIWNLIDRALYWLRNNTYTNKLLKWDTAKWGEIKADFGRK